MRREMILVEGGILKRKPVFPHINSFLIDKYTVTVEHYVTSGVTPCKKGQRPLTGMSFVDILRFCNILSAIEQLESVYTFGAPNIKHNPLANGYRLPTIDEWEFAALGGNESQGFLFSGSNDVDAIGWYAYNSHDNIQPVGLKLPNELGIHDMSGNIVERCWDSWYNSATDDTSIFDPTAKYVTRTCKGGCFLNSMHNVTVYSSTKEYPNANYKHIGFRLVRSIF